jgi:metal-responsive CopG/Arc/MetJ family transcriptional regulator
MARIYTELRISHKTIEEKQDYERKLDEALKAKGYKDRTEWLKEKYRELIREGK